MNTRKNPKKIFQRIAENNDREAFTLFFKEYYANLIQFAMLFVPQFEQAEDIVSNVMIRLIKKAKDICKVKNFDSYLFIVVRNEALDYLKKEKKHRFIVIDSENDFFLKEYVDPCEKLIEKELRDLIFDTVESFPPKRRMVYKLVKDENLSYKEVANLMDISIRTVGVHITVAVKEIKKVLGRYLEAKSANPNYLKIAKSILLLLFGF